MTRSEGGQRLVDIDEVSRLLDERRRAASDRPIVAQSARNRFPGIVTRIERDGVAAVVEVMAGPHRMVSLHDRGGRRRARTSRSATRPSASSRPPTSSSRSRPRRSRAHEVAPRPSLVGLVAGRLAACSAAALAVGAPPGAPSAAARRRRRPAPRRPSLTIFGAASLKGALDKAKTAYEAANPGTTLTISTDSSVGARDQDRAGRARRRLPVRRHDEPQEARRQGPRGRRGRRPSPEPADGHRPDGQPGRHHVAGGPRQVRGQGHRRRRRRADHQVRHACSSRTWPRSPGYPADFAAEVRRQRRVQGGQRQGRRRQDRARRGRCRHRLRDRRQGLDQGHAGRCPRHGQRARRPMPASSSRPPRTRPPRRRSSTGSPGPTGRRSSPLRVPAAAVIDGAAGRDCARRGATRPRGVAAGAALGRAVARALAGLFALFLGLPVPALVVRAVLDGSLAIALTSPVVLDALGLSLVTTAISLVITVALGLPLAFVLARRRSAARASLEAIVDLPIVLPPSVAGLALLLVFGRRGLLVGTFELLGISVPFTTVAVDPRPDVRLGAVLRPLRPDRHRRRRPRPRGCRARRRRLRTAAVPVDHRPARRRGPGRRPGHELGAGARRVRGDDHVRRATSRAGRRRCRSSSTASSRAATSTPRSLRRRSSSSPPSGCSSRSGLLRWGQVLDTRTVP